MGLLRLSLLPFALYATALGVVTLVFPGPLNEVMGYAAVPSCYPWIRIIAPMALPLGLGLFLAIRDPRRNVALLQATLVLAACQIPLDVYFLARGWFDFAQIGLDLFMLAATAGAIVAFYPERRALVRFRQGPPDRGAGRADRALRLCLAVMVAYLLGGWLFATFLPQLMNDLLQYPLAPSCVPWVQYTGPPALALGVAFALAIDDPARNRAIITVVGISGCALEIALDLYLIRQGAIELWMASIDLPIVVYGLVTFSRAAPALAGRRQPVGTEPAISARPPALLPRPAPSEVPRLALALPWLYPRLLLGLWGDLRRALGERLPGLGGAEQATKLRRRFLTGAMLGYAVSRYLYYGNRRGGAGHLLNAEIYGLWGITIITLDCSVDAGQLGGEAAAAFLEQGLARMLRRPSGLGAAGPALAGVGPREPTGEAAAAGRRLAESLCELLGAKIELAERRRGVAEAELAAAREDFERRCRVLWSGELRSLEQVIVDPEHTWSWYYRQCLNQKTLEFALAPIALYCATPTARRRFERLERAFLTLNGGYAHTQLLDDIADLAGDTARGLVTAPGYLLLSQGQLAERLLAAGEVDRAELHALAHASDLLVADLWPGPACDGREEASAGGSGDGAGCIARALANAGAELSWPMQALGERRRRESAAYAGALGTGEADSAIRAVLDSGVARRILGTVQDEQRTRRLRAELAAVEDRRLRSVLLLFNRLMARAYRRACRVATAPP